jgi:hypothetical protein|tara:strand:+ start:402 stop:539 length:138 start_codon:yes stop_codon:yes gene_type:complete
MLYHQQNRSIEKIRATTVSFARPVDVETIRRRGERGEERFLGSPR